MLQSDAMSHMSHEEFMGNLILLIVGGNDTTRNSMSAYAYGLHQFPKERAKLEANHDPDLAVNAMHEILRSEEHTSELQSLMRISYAVFCLNKKKRTIKKPTQN